MPWSSSFRALRFFLFSINFEKAELGIRSDHLTILNNFVDKVLRANARSWKQKKMYLLHQFLSIEWNSDLARRFGYAKS
jgi:hypothetical protein